LLFAVAVKVNDGVLFIVGLLGTLQDESGKLFVEIGEQVIEILVFVFGIFERLALFNGRSTNLGHAKNCADILAIFGKRIAGSGGAVELAREKLGNDIGGDGMLFFRSL